MIEICISFPPPSYKDLLDQLMTQLRSEMPDLSKLTELAGLIGIPIPIYIDISQFTNELSQLVQYFQSMLSLKTLLSMIQPMINFLGLALENLLPKIPYLNMNIIELLAMNPNDLRNMVMQILREKRDEFLNALSDFIPLPIFFDISVLAFEVNAILKAIMNMNMLTLIQLAVDLIQKVIDKLELSALLQLPKIPTLAELKAMLMQMIKQKIAELKQQALSEIEDFLDEFEALKYLSMLQNFSISELLNMIVLQGLPKIPFPIPFLPDFSSLAYELTEGLTIFMQQIYMSIINMIMEFVKRVLSMLSFSFPTICISIPTLSDVLPEIPEIPQIPNVSDLTNGVIVTP